MKNNKINKNHQIEKKISGIVKTLIKKYVNEYSISCNLINHGNCKNFSEELYVLAIKNNIKGVILSDGLFFDPFDDEESSMMQNIEQYGNKPTDFNLIGLPSHCWFYYGGKHYDCDTPQGVTDVFDLPIIKNFYKKHGATNKVSVNK